MRKLLLIAVVAMTASIATPTPAAVRMQLAGKILKNDKSGQLLTDEREGKEQGSTYWKQRASRPITAMWAG